MRGRVALSMLDAFDRLGWVTWERTDSEARLLMITNLWPDHEFPARGTFIRYSVEGLAARDVRCDVLYIRGYRTLLAYAAGALAAALIPVAFPGRYSVAHSHGGETALAARFFHGAPVLASYLGTDLLGTKVGGGLALRTKCYLRSLVLRRHACLFEQTTTKSEEMERLLKKSSQHRNTVIPDGVNRARFAATDRLAARRSLGWPATSRIVLFAGRSSSPEKRLWLARRVVDQAAEALPEVELRIADGVPGDAMPLYYSAADCLLHVSASEGSPNVVKEALACDLPVVATPSGDIRELLGSIDGCVICPADVDALASALASTLRLERRSLDARDRTRHLGSEPITDRLIAWYEEAGLVLAK